MKPIITKSFPAQASANEKFSEKNAGVKFAIGESSLGSILVACGDQGVRAIFLGDSAEELVRDLQAQLPETPLTGDDAVCRNYVSQVAAFIEAPRKISICHWTPGEFLRVLEASAVRASRVGTAPSGF